MKGKKYSRPYSTDSLYRFKMVIDGYVDNCTTNLERTERVSDETILRAGVVHAEAQCALMNLTRS